MTFFHPLCGSLIKIRCYKGITINRMLQPFDHGIYYWLRTSEIGICNPHRQRIWISYSWSYIIPFGRTSIMPVDHFIKIVFHLVVLLYERSGSSFTFSIFKIVSSISFALSTEKATWARPSNLSVSCSFESGTATLPDMSSI